MGVAYVMSEVSVAPVPPVSRPASTAVDDGRARVARGREGARLAVGWEDCPFFGDDAGAVSNVVATVRKDAAGAACLAAVCRS